MLRTCQYSLYKCDSVSRCTLNNQDFIDNLGVAPGDIVEVALFNEVIPGIVSVVEKGDGIGKPVVNIDETSRYR